MLGGRMVVYAHNLSDGFVFAGVRSQPRVLSAVSPTKVQLRSDDGAAHIGIDPTTHAISAQTTGNISAVAGGTLVATSTGDMTLTGPNINLTGTVNITGAVNQSGGAVAVGGAMSVAGALTNAGKNVGATHVHSGVTPGAGNTGAPT
jgi:phage baseplate assembly protein V